MQRLKKTILNVLSSVQELILNFVKINFKLLIAQTLTQISPAENYCIRELKCWISVEK